MRSPALVLLALAAGFALAGALAQAPPASPLALGLHVEAPASLPAGAEATIPVTIQRHADGDAVPGPGEAELLLAADEGAACQPARQHVALDPLTGRGHANLTCRPQQPGTWALDVRADAEGHRPANGSTPLEVHPDRLQGDLWLGEAEAYRFPLRLSLEPMHLEQAPVEVRISAEHGEAPLAFAREPVEGVADGSTIRQELVARHGPGSYEVRVHAEGPLTQPWTASADLEVPQPPGTGRLELNATVEPGEPHVALTGEGVNDDGKSKRPGDELITRLTSRHVDEVNVSVLRAEGTETVELDRRLLAVDEDGRLEHVFAHEPLPAEPLWVQAWVGESSVARTAQIRDLRAEAELAGPASVLADGRPWEGQLRLADPNFGSTPTDPGPVFGLPDVTWTVYRGSLVAEGFAVEIGPFSGGSEGEAETSRIPWPQGTEAVDAEPGEAIVPVRAWPPAAAEPGTYRLSVYAPDDARLGGGSWELAPAPQPTIEAGQARPGERLNVTVDVEDPTEQTRVELRVHADGQRVGNVTLAEPGNASIELPAPLPAGTPVRIEAWGKWPGRPEAKQPDAVVEQAVLDLPPHIEAHASLDGAPAPSPVPVHPAAAHELEIAYTAVDPNEGPVPLASASIEGPDGEPAWPVEIGEGIVHVSVPEGVAVGRYTVELVAPDDARETSWRVPLDVAATLRLGVEGPEEVTLTQGGTRRVNLTVHNRGSLPVAEVVLFLDTEMDLTARITNGTSWAEPGQALGLALDPQATGTVPVALTAEGSAGRGSVSLTLAGVAP